LGNINRTNKIYKNKDYENSKKYIERRNEIITYRLLIFLAVAVEKVGFFIYAMNVSINGLPKLKSLFLAGTVITGVLVAGSLSFLIYRVKSNINEKETVLHSKGVFITALFWFLSDLIIFLTYQKWIPVMTAAAITATVLVYVYYLYQREFFYFSLFTAICCFFLYFTESYFLSSGLRMAFRILLITCAAFILAFAVVLKKGKGKIKSKSFNKNIQILEKNSKYLPFFILAALVALVAVAGFFISTSFLYLIFAVVGYFIIIGIYFTIKII